MGNQVVFLCSSSNLEKFVSESPDHSELISGANTYFALFFECGPCHSAHVDLEFGIIGVYHHLCPPGANT